MRKMAIMWSELGTVLGRVQWAKCSGSAEFIAREEEEVAEIGPSSAMSHPTPPTRARFMLLKDYETGDFFDEMFTADGNVRPHYRRVAEEFGDIAGCCVAAAPGCAKGAPVLAVPVPAPTNGLLRVAKRQTYHVGIRSTQSEK